MPPRAVTAGKDAGWPAAYLPYGKTQVQAGNAITNNLRFPGQHFDAETGWHCRNR